MSSVTEVPCTRCTYMNPADAKICEMCEAPLSPVAGVQCPTCTYDNPIGAQRCDLCGSVLTKNDAATIEDDDDDDDEDGGVALPQPSGETTEQGASRKVDAGKRREEQSRPSDWRRDEELRVSKLQEAELRLHNSARTGSDRQQSSLTGFLNKVSAGERHEELTEDDEEIVEEPPRTWGQKLKALERAGKSRKSRKYHQLPDSDFEEESEVFDDAGPLQKVGASKRRRKYHQLPDSDFEEAPEVFDDAGSLQKVGASKRRRQDSRTFNPALEEEPEFIEEVSFSHEIPLGAAQKSKKKSTKKAASKKQNRQPLADISSHYLNTNAGKRRGESVESSNLREESPAKKQKHNLGSQPDEEDPKQPNSVLIGRVGIDTPRSPTEIRACLHSAQLKKNEHEDNKRYNAKQLRAMVEARGIQKKTTWPKYSIKYLFEDDIRDVVYMYHLELRLWDHYQNKKLELEADGVACHFAPGVYDVNQISPDAAEMTKNGDNHDNNIADAASLASLPKATGLPWMASSVSGVWNFDLFPADSNLRQESHRFSLDKGLLRLSAWVHSTYKGLQSHPKLSESTRSFIDIISPESLIQLCWGMLLDDLKALLGTSVSDWNAMFDSYDEIKLENNTSQGIYFIGLEHKSGFHEYYIGSTGGHQGFHGRVFENHLNRQYREKNKKTPLYQRWKKAAKIRVRLLAVQLPMFAQNTVHGDRIIKMCESFLLAIIGYPSHQFTRVANECQFGLNWPSDPRITAENYSQHETDRKFKGLNKSIPYLESSTMSQQLNWPKFLTGHSLPVIKNSAKNELYLRLAKVRFIFSAEQTAKLAKDNIRIITLQAFIEKDGNPHPNQWACLPMSEMQQSWERGSSLALKVQYKSSEAEDVKFFWLQQKGLMGNASARSSNLGKAKFAMSLIEYIEGTPQIPAKAERFSFETPRNDTDDTKVWATGLNVTKKYEEQLEAAINDSAVDGKLSCWYCSYSFSSATLASVNLHLQYKASCKKRVVEELLELTEEEVEEHIWNCGGCKRKYFSYRGFRDHLTRFANRDCLPFENERRAIDGDDPLDLWREDYVCSWCQKPHARQSDLDKHFHTDGSSKCRQKENAQRGKEGLELLPPPSHLCPKCQTAFSTKFLLDMHLSEIDNLECLLVEQEQRMQERQQLFIPTMYFCQLDDCPLATNEHPTYHAKADARNHHVKERHTEAFRSMGGIPSMEESKKLPDRFKTYLDRHGLSELRDIL